MNRIPILFSAILLFSIGISAQQSKTYKETFNVGEDATLRINTTHTDIEFETWDNDQVAIEAVVTLENASDEEAEDYFSNDPISIMGNSKEIEINTANSSDWAYRFTKGDLDFDFDFEPFFEVIDIPDLPEIAVLPEMPPLPPIKMEKFDYEAYQKDGEKYLKKWSKEFQKGFDEDYQKKMEEWGKRMEERTKRWEERNADRLKEMEERMEERAEEMEKRAEERAKLAEERAEMAEKRRIDRIKARSASGNSFLFTGDDDESSSIFYLSSDGKHKKYKVKKTIKVKMPKSVKLKLNIKHGEVKLAALSKDINASLRYASLLASDINGKNTEIEASYSPMIVERWNEGKLSTRYSDKIKIAKVKDIRLNAASSNIVIDRLDDSAFVVTNLGKLAINSVANTFTNVDVSIENGEFVCDLPDTAVTLYVNGSKSTVIYPENLKLEKVNNFDNVVYSGYRTNNNSGKRITVNSKFSEVTLLDK